MDGLGNAIWDHVSFCWMSRAFSYFLCTEIPERWAILQYHLCYPITAITADQ
jgi:hypothetical protein